MHAMCVCVLFFYTSAVVVTLLVHQAGSAYMPAPLCSLRTFQCRHSRTALNQSLLGSASAATLGTGHLVGGWVGQ